MNRLRLVVISEDPIDKASFHQMLQTSEADIVVASSVNESLSAFACQQPDVLIWDVDFLDDERYLQMRSLRDLETTLGWHTTPAILVSGSVRDLDFNQAISIGFRRFLARPIESDRLLAAVTSLIEPSS